jgi:UDP-glucose 4-epimerase
MTTLIVGGCGFIGLNVAEALLRRGDDVVLADARPPPAEAACAFAELSGSYTYRQTDVTERTTVQALFTGDPIAQVIYGAAVTSDAEREIRSPAHVLNVNVLGLTQVIDCARLAGVTRMINLSSGSAYGDGGYASSGAVAPLDEVASQSAPASLYSISKLAGEGICNRLASLTGFDLFSVRLSTAFGPWELDSGARDTLSAPMQAGILALRGQHATLARIDARDWTYSRDIANAVVALLDTNTRTHRLYNISSQALSSVVDWGVALAAHFPGFNCRVVHDNEQASVELHGTEDRLIMCTRRLRQDTGHRSTTDLHNSAADFAAWIKRYPQYWGSMAAAPGTVTPSLDVNQAVD